MNRTNLPNNIIPSDFSRNSSNRSISIEAMCRNDNTDTSPSAVLIRKKQKPRDNVRAFFSRLGRNKDDLPSLLSKKKLDVVKNKHGSFQLQLSQQSLSSSRKGCLKVLTQEQSLLSSCNKSSHHQCILKRRVTDRTADDDDDNDDDLYGEWDSTPITLKETAITFGTIDVIDVDLSSALSTPDNLGDSSHSIPSVTSIDSQLTVEQYETLRPSDTRKSLRKINQKVDLETMSMKKALSGCCRPGKSQEVLGKARRRTAAGQTA
uniref:Uncharacterized protein n=1 Tax=Ditylum brightwellii TaxID=49249 RepID=A0A7S4VRJ2_9STRA|mmetsp:Transcript_33342/g.50277  ORF Transcript_33342/g.50277 Transcript_33342/m.50277 type:complete len:263 (+) Transcript_33342:150-938(+)